MNTEDDILDPKLLRASDDINETPPTPDRMAKKISLRETLRCTSPRPSYPKQFAITLGQWSYK
jgi:hypothetical protein